MIYFQYFFVVFLIFIFNLTIYVAYSIPGTVLRNLTDRKETKIRSGVVSAVEDDDRISDSTRKNSLLQNRKTKRAAEKDFHENASPRVTPMLWSVKRNLNIENKKSIPVKNTGEKIDSEPQNLTNSSTNMKLGSYLPFSTKRLLYGKHQRTSKFKKKFRKRSDDQDDIKPQFEEDTNERFGGKYEPLYYRLKYKELSIFHIRSQPSSSELPGDTSATHNQHSQRRRKAIYRPKMSTKSSTSEPPEDMPVAHNQYSERRWGMTDWSKISTKYSTSSELPRDIPATHNQHSGRHREAIDGPKTSHLSHTSSFGRNRKANLLSYTHTASGVPPDKIIDFTIVVIVLFFVYAICYFLKKYLCTEEDRVDVGRNS